MGHSFALSQFFYFVDVPSPQHCKSLALVLHCLRFLEHCIAIAAKTCASAFPPQLPLLHICDPAGVCGNNYRNVFCPLALKGLKNVKGVKLGQKHNVRYCVWRSRIADRNNAPRSVSRVTTSFRDDDEGGLSTPCCLMLFLLSFYFLRQP